MKNTFSGYYRPSADQCAAQFKVCVFSFDANVLLNLYRYTPDSAATLINVLQSVKDRVWLSHQAGQEYHNNRVEVIISQRNMYQLLRDELAEMIKRMNQQRRSESHHITNLVAPIRQALEQVQRELQKKEADHPDLLKADPILDALTSLFDGKVGHAYEPEEHKKKLALAKHRIESGIPPGYLDSVGKKKKEGDRQYGDAIIWFQLLDFAREHRKPVVFITDETGDDWWSIAQGRTIGPRPELLQEMHNSAGVWFYMYSTDQFLEHSKGLLEVVVTPAAIKEAKELRRVNEEASALRSDIVEYERGLRDMVGGLTEYERRQRDVARLMSGGALGELERSRREMERLVSGGVAQYERGLRDMVGGLAEYERRQRDVARLMSGGALGELERSRREMERLVRGGQRPLQGEAKSEGQVDKVEPPKSEPSPDEGEPKKD